MALLICAALIVWGEANALMRPASRWTMAATWKSSPKPPAGHLNRRPVSKSSAPPQDLSHRAYQATRLEEDAVTSVANSPPDWTVRL